MTKINWKPGTMLSPLPPVMVSCGTVDKPNVMTVAWTGIVSSDPVMTYVSIRPGRYSHDIIKESGEFVINLPTWTMVTAVDFCGVKSGRDINKFEEMNLTAASCANVSAPQVAECPVSIECKVKSVTNYGVHDMFLAEVVGVSVDDKYIDEKGALDLEKAGILAFAHGKYYTLGRNLGSFGFSVNKAKLKEMQKMEKVEVTVKSPKTIDPEAEPQKDSRPRRSPFGMRKTPERKSYNRTEKSSEDRDERRSYNRDGEDRRAPRRDNDERRAPRRDNDGERRSYNRDGEDRRAPRRNDERRAPRRDNDGERRPYGRDGEDRRVRDENRKPFNRDGGERRDFRGDGDRRRNFGANDERRAPRRDSGNRRPSGGFGKKPVGRSSAPRKSFKKD